jgi:hypothetical protein
MARIYAMVEKLSKHDFGYIYEKKWTTLIDKDNAEYATIVKRPMDYKTICDTILGKIERVPLAALEEMDDGKQLVQSIFESSLSSLFVVTDS